MYARMKEEDEQVHNKNTAITQPRKSLTVLRRGERNGAEYRPIIQ